MSSFTKKQKKKVGIGGLIMIAMIIIVFVFWGGGTGQQGSSGGTVLASVNGVKITQSNFQKRLLQRIQAFESQLNQTITPEMLKQLRIPDQILTQMINELLIQQEAKHYGIHVSNQELSKLIIATPAFYDEKGVFSAKRYKYLLARLRLKPGEYEEQVRDQLLTSKLTNAIRDSIVTSKEEAKLDYLVSQDQRNLEAVKVSATNLEGKSTVLPSEIDGFIKTNDAEIASYYAVNIDEFKKTKDSTAKPLSEVKVQIAEKLLKERGVEEKAKALAISVLEAWKNNRPITKIISPYNIKPITTGFFSRTTSFIPNIGRSAEVTNEAFSLSSTKPLPTSPMYVNGSWVVIKFKDAKSADLSKFEKESSKIVQEQNTRKTNDALRLLFADMQTKAKITRREFDYSSNLFQ